MIDVGAGEEAIIVIRRRWKRRLTLRWDRQTGGRVADTPPSRDRPDATAGRPGRQFLQHADARHRHHLLIHIWWQAQTQQQQQDGRCIPHGNDTAAQSFIPLHWPACRQQQCLQDSLYSAPLHSYLLYSVLLLVFYVEL